MYRIWSPLQQRQPDVDQMTTCSAQASCHRPCCPHAWFTSMTHTRSHGNPHYYCSNNQLAVTTWARWEAAADPAVSTAPDESLFIHTTAHVQHVASAPKIDLCHVWLATNPSGCHCSAAQLHSAGCGEPPNCWLARSPPCLQHQTNHGRNQVRCAALSAEGCWRECCLHRHHLHVQHIATWQKGSPSLDHGIPHVIYDMPWVAT
jgi:hypothetical protein